jgi:hypothetical protein
VKANRRFEWAYHYDLQGRTLSETTQNMKCRLAFTGQQGVISQKMEHFIITAVISSNPIFFILLCNRVLIYRHHKNIFRCNHVALLLVSCEIIKEEPGFKLKESVLLLHCPLILNIYIVKVRDLFSHYIFITHKRNARCLTRKMPDS